MQTGNFETLYQQLNAEQRKAVDTIEGPVMVVAGPGTGKTQILSARILNILQKTDARPQNILCLTYTEAGVFAMQQRLANFMGADAYKVNIYTFHALCNRIIRENPELFSNRNLKLMDKLQEFDLMNELIDSLPANSLIKSYEENPEVLRYSLLNLFDFMQKENIEAGFLDKRKAFLLDKENFKLCFPQHTYKKTTKFGEAGSIKEAEYEKYKEAWNKLTEAAGLLEVYREKKKNAGLFDYNDMQLWVNEAFEKYPFLLLYYQEQFQYILVDEYQDTSGIQNRLLFQLISFWEDNPNCFVVGDDDQSVYKFQGARLDNMLDFRNRYQKHLSIVMLTRNYRSSEDILSLAAASIKNNSRRLVNEVAGLSKDLIASGPNQWVKQQDPLVYLYQNPLHEALGLAKRLKRLHTEQQIPYNEMAVVYARHKQAIDCIETFNELDIPYQLTRNIDVLQEPVISHTCNWIEFLAAELRTPGEGEYLLMPLMHARETGLTPNEILEFAAGVRNLKATFSYTNWRGYAGLKSAEIAPGIAAFFDSINQMLQEMHSQTLPQVLMHIFNNAGIVQQALNAPDSEFQLELLHTFMGFVREKVLQNPEMNLKDLTELIHKMRISRFEISLERRIGSRNGVNFTTAHGSKGLEFEVVNLIGCNANSWEADSGNSLPYRLQSLLLADEVNGDEAERDAEKDELFEEKRRLFYVGLTRAKKNLFVSYCKEGYQKNELRASTFISEIEKGMPVSDPALSATEIQSLALRFLTKKQPPVIKPEESEWLRKRVEEHVFSPSSIADLYECGLRFYYTRLIRVPAAGSDNLLYGNAVHDTLRWYLKNGTSKDLKWHTIEEVLHYFKEEMLQKRGELSLSAYEKRTAQGLAGLPVYLAERQEVFKTQTSIDLERKLNTRIEDIEVTARLDKIIYNGSHLEVVDYKTGKPKNALSKLKAPLKTEEDNLKFPNRYWFQLGMYVLICRSYFQNQYQVNTAWIDCVDKDESGSFPLIKTVYNSQELDFIKALIVNAKIKLNNFEFNRGCGKESCEWCNFVKSTGQVVLPVLEPAEDEA